MPSAYYIAKNSAHPDVANDFLGFISSVEGTEVLSKALAPAGPYVIKDSTLPDTVMPAVKDIQPYLDSGLSVPALEFLSPVKGALLPDITVSVGSGQISAAEAASEARPGRRKAGQAARASWLVDNCSQIEERMSTKEAGPQRPASVVFPSASGRRAETKTRTLQAGR